MGERVEVLFLSENEVKECITYKEAVRIAEEVLRKQGHGEVEMPPKQLLNLRKHGLNSYANSMPAYLKYLGISGIKWGGGFAANLKERKYPHMVQTIILASPLTGIPFAMMSASWITTLKTGSETAIAGKYLAAHDNGVVLTIIGLGDQGTGALEAWLALHDWGDINIKEIRLIDIREEAVQRATNSLKGRYEGRVSIPDSIEDAVKGANAIVTATHAEKPIVMKKWLVEGVYVGCLGSYPEVDADAVLSADKLVVDNWEQNIHRGCFQYLIEEGKISRTDIVGELPDIVAGKAPGRERKDERIIASLIGLGSVDLGIAYKIWQNAKEKGIGQRVLFMEV